MCKLGIKRANQCKPYNVYIQTPTYKKKTVSGFVAGGASFDPSDFGSKKMIVCNFGSPPVEA